MRSWLRISKNQPSDLQEVTFLALRNYRAATFLSRCQPNSRWRALSQAAHIDADEKILERIKKERALNGESQEKAATSREISLVDSGIEDKTSGVQLATKHADIAAEEPSTTRSVDESQSQLPPRIVRKLRRQREGTYKPLASNTETEPGEVEVESVEMLLSRLEKLGGREQWRKNPIIDHEDSKSQSGPVGKSTRERSSSQKKQSPKAESKEKSNPRTTQTPPAKKERWQVQKEALQHKFGDSGWKPRKRLSPDTLEGIRALHTSNPATYTTQVLASNFKVSPEAVRRILRSKWKPTDKEVEERRARWEKRGVKKWQEMAKQGAKPPKKWREMGIGSPFASNRDAGRKKERVRRTPSISWEEVVGRANT